jgi:hypothetical protein
MAEITLAAGNKLHAAFSDIVFEIACTEGISTATMLHLCGFVREKMRLLDEMEGV